MGSPIPARFKCVLLGEAGVGKSSMAMRLKYDRFDPDGLPTIGAGYLTCQVNVDDVRVELEIWDTAGQERYQALTPMYYRGADIALLVFDARHPTRGTSEHEWRERLLLGAPEAVVAVALNKCDLLESVVSDRASDAALTFWTSAKSNRNVEATFTAAIRHALRVRATPPNPVLDLRHTECGTCGGCGLY